MTNETATTGDTVLRKMNTSGIMTVDLNPETGEPLLADQDTPTTLKDLEEIAQTLRLDVLKTGRTFVIGAPKGQTLSQAIQTLAEGQGLSAIDLRLRIAQAIAEEMEAGGQIRFKPLES